ncbi:hypothetical protein [Piscinibacter sp.]|uniref:hypothetical protein n=1 Tax=Piscinibacter sp. TaxID=1903157 RepID=UPI0039E62E84
MGHFSLPDPVRAARRRRVAAMMASLALLAACGGGHDGDDPNAGAPPPPPVEGPPPPAVDTTPKPTAVGVPVGSEVVKTIGPAGGTVVSADGAASIVIPAGALAGDTPIAIQRITDNAPGSLRTYAMRPEGQTFAVPVTVQFSYDENELMGTAPEAFDIGYQDANRYWRALPVATLDTTARTVSVSTTHFTDWALLSTIRLTPTRAAVRVGSKLSLDVVSCGRRDDPGTGQPALVETCGPSPLRVDTWAVNGTTYGDARVGTVDSAGTVKGTYTAPANKPSPSTVAVSCSVQLPAGDRAKVLLKTEVQVVQHAGWNGSIWYSMRGMENTTETVPLPGNIGSTTTEKMREVFGGVILTIEADNDFSGPNIIKVSKVEGNYDYHESVARSRTAQDGPCLRQTQGSLVTDATGKPTLPAHNLMAIEFGNPTMTGGAYKIAFAPAEGKLTGTSIEQISQTATGENCVPTPPTDVRVDYEGMIDVIAIDLAGSAPEKADNLSGHVAKESMMLGLPVTWEVHWQLNHSVK